MRLHEANERLAEVQQQLLQYRGKLRHFTRIAEIAEEGINRTSNEDRRQRLGQILDLCRQASKVISDDVSALTEELVKLTRIIEGPKDVSSRLH